MSVIELSDNKQNYEIVNFFKVDEKRFNEYLKRAEHEGGEVLITKKNDFQGAARLSALESDSKKLERSNANMPQSLTSETILSNNSITDNSETFKGGVEESNITPEKQRELEKQENINWERTLKRRDNVDIEIIKRAANLKNGKKYSTGEIKMLIGSARRGTLNTLSLRSRFDKLMKLVEEPDDRITVQGGLSEFAEFHNPNATDEELVNAAINNLLHNRKPLNITEKANDYGKHIEQMYNDIETSNNIIRTGNNYEERANIYLDETTKLINKYGEELPQDTFIYLVKTVNESDENIMNPSYNNEQGVKNEQTTRNGIKSNIDETGRGLQTQSPERNTRRINRNNDSNNEQSRESSRNEYTQETSTDRRTDVNPLENSEKINNNEEKGVDNERQIDRRTNQGTNRENSEKLSTTLQMDKTMVSEQSKRLDTNNQGTIRPNRSERTTDNVTIGNERLTKESKISSSDKELIEKEYKN